MPSQILQSHFHRYVACLCSGRYGYAEYTEKQEDVKRDETSPVEEARRN